MLEAFLLVGALCVSGPMVTGCVPAGSSGSSQSAAQGQSGETSADNTGNGEETDTGDSGSEGGETAGDDTTDGDTAGGDTADSDAGESTADDSSGEDDGAGDTEFADGDDPCAYPHQREVRVGNAAELSQALSRARTGDLIRLNAGRYPGRFKIEASGSADQPIILCGSRDSILDGGSLGTGYVLHLKDAHHWVVAGLTITQGKKGIMLDGSSYNRLTALLVHDIGEEGVHFRKASSHNTLAHSEVRGTGKLNPGYGEAVYIGSAVNHWVDNKPDRSDYNQILNNVFGPDVAAEHVDIKEGTTGGLVRGNQFDGRGISGENYADSWIDLKGNNYRIEGNTGANTPKDGFQLHARVSGWGNNNVFADNLATVNGPGYGFWLDRDAKGNIVRCDNKVESARSGFANVNCR